MFTFLESATIVISQSFLRLLVEEARARAHEGNFVLRSMMVNMSKSEIKDPFAPKVTCKIYDET